MNTFAEALIATREAAGFPTRVEFSQSSDIPLRTLDDLETGRRQRPQQKTLAKLFRALPELEAALRSDDVRVGDEADNEDMFADYDHDVRTILLLVANHLQGLSPEDRLDWMRAFMSDIGLI